MGYRTLLRFARPLKVRLEVAGPGSAPRVLDARLAGFGREGAVHFVEIAGAEGREAERVPLADVHRAVRRGIEVDLRRVILSREERAAFQAGRRVRSPPRWRPERHWRNFRVGIVVLAMLVVAGLAVSRITGREEDAARVMGYGAIAVVVVQMLLLIPPLGRRWADLRLRFGLWR